MNTASAGAIAAGVSRDYSAAALSLHDPLPIQDVVLHHLRTPDQIENVIFLRDEIDLSVHTAAGRQFEELEKKETTAGSFTGSSLAANGSARSASSRWAIS
jgi:hypothetical protein